MSFEFSRRLLAAGFRRHSVRAGEGIPQTMYGYSDVDPHQQ